MKNNEIHETIQILRKEIRQWKTPIVTIVADESRNPFHVLISCILSLRTKDETTALAFGRLHKKAKTPKTILNLTEEEIADLIYPVGFYRQKAKTIREICQKLLDEYLGQVPDEIDELLKFKGVGRKTANLVVTLGFNKPGICVDTHVHRICNRWGYISTKTPDESEFALRKKLPREYWIEINDLLVSYGQNLCVPISPKCSACKIKPFCRQNKVQKSR